MGSTGFKETSAFLAGIGLLPANRGLLRAGLRRRADGWRRGAGLVLRGEAATFVLSGFGLDVWSDVEKPPSLSVEAAQAHCAERLAGFLANETDAHVWIKRGELEDTSSPVPGRSHARWVTQMGQPVESQTAA